MKPKALVLATTSAVAEAPSPLFLWPSLPATWAVVCGCVAVGRVPQRPEFALVLCASWLLADVLLGYLFSTLATLRAASKETARVIVDRRELVVPYAQSGSLGQRLADGVARAKIRLGRNGHQTVAQWGVAAVLAAGLCLVVGTYLGRPQLLVVSCALAVATVLGLHSASGEDRERRRRLFGVQTTVAWLLGVMALGLGSARHAWAGLAVGLLAALGGGSLRASTRLISLLVWMGLVALLVSSQQFIAAGLLATVAIVYLWDGNTLGTKTRLAGGHCSLPWFAAVLVLALALATGS